MMLLDFIIQIYSDFKCFSFILYLCKKEHFIFVFNLNYFMGMVFFINRVFLFVIDEIVNFISTEQLF